MNRVEKTRLRQMRGVGGPLLCIGDLLSDVTDDNGGNFDHRQNSHPSLPTATAEASVSPDGLPRLFQENYSLLIDSLSGTDHSWTASTLKICAALEEADRLVLSCNSNINLVLEKIELLKSILKRGNAAVVKAMETLQGS